MDERQQLRVELTGDVAKLLARHRSVRDMLPAIRADGVAPFVVAFPEDSLRFLSDRAPR